MSDLGALFEIYRTSELFVKTRITLIKKLGNAINKTHGSNITEPLVYELVLLLDPNNEIKDDEHYKRFI